MIEKIDFPKVMMDNESNYFQYLEGVIYSIDELAQISIKKSSDKYLFRIVPSLPRYSQVLLDELINFHKMLHIKLNLSKSMKTNSVLSFSITLFL